MWSLFSYFFFLMKKVKQQTHKFFFYLQLLKEKISWSPKTRKLAFLSALFQCTLNKVTKTTTASRKNCGTLLRPTLLFVVLCKLNEVERCKSFDWVEVCKSSWQFTQFLKFWNFFFQIFKFSLLSAHFTPSPLNKKLLIWKMF